MHWAEPYDRLTGGGGLTVGNVYRSPAGLRVRKLAHAAMGETTLSGQRDYRNLVSFCASPKGDDRTRSRVMLT